MDPSVLRSPRSTKYRKPASISGKLLRLAQLLLLLSIVLIHASRSLAEDFFIAETAGPSGGGASASDPAPVGFFNNAENWDSPAKLRGKIGPGDRVHLVGTITEQLVFQGSGNADARIQLVFEPGANMTSSAWPETGAISLPRRQTRALQYITIDGGPTGTIANTDNGSDLRLHEKSTGIWLEDVSHVT